MAIILVKSVSEEGEGTYTVGLVFGAAADRQTVLTVLYGILVSLWMAA